MASLIFGCVSLLTSSIAQARLLDHATTLTPVRLIASETNSASEAAPRPDALNSCVGCHSADPKIPFKPADEASLKTLLTTARDQKKNFILNDIKRRIKLKKTDADFMPQGGSPLSEDTVTAVMKYLETLSGQQAD